MDRPVREIDLQDIERSIQQGFQILKFNPIVESRFERDISDERCNRMIRINYIGLIIYHCFLIGDFSIVGDVIYVDLFMHFFVMTPVTIGLHFLLKRRPSPWIREGMEAFGILILASTICAVVSTSRLPDRDVINLTQILVVLFAIMMQRIQFWYAVALCFIMQIIHVIGLKHIDTISDDRKFMYCFLFFGMTVFSLVGGYLLEHERRMGYLLRLRDLLRNEELEKISLRDALTGIANRRALEVAIGRLAEITATEPKRCVAILLLDIDYFKQFNDINGHQQGDNCLVQVASIISGSLRAGDQVVYRFGGEEFIVILENNSLNDACAVAERIRSNVERAGIVRNSDTQDFVTVSIGVASGCHEQGFTPEILISEADNALYSAKRDGRNRVGMNEARHLACD